MDVACSSMMSVKFTIFHGATSQILISLNSCNCGTDLFHCGVIDSIIWYIHIGENIKNQCVLNLCTDWNWNKVSYVNFPVPEVACMQKWVLWPLLRWGGSNCASHCAAWSVATCTVQHQCCCTGCFMGTFKTAAICHRHERYMAFVFWVCNVIFVLYFFLGFCIIIVFHIIFVLGFCMLELLSSISLQEINHSALRSQHDISDYHMYIQYW
jgi:hypothetical protein